MALQKIHIEGVERRSGVSTKTGRPYDFWTIHLLGPRRGVSGKAAYEINLDPSIVGAVSLVPGADYEVETDFEGSILTIAPL